MHPFEPSHYFIEPIKYKSVSLSLSFFVRIGISVSSAVSLHFAGGSRNYIFIATFVAIQTQFIRPACIRRYVTAFLSSSLPYYTVYGMQWSSKTGQLDSNKTNMINVNKNPTKID